MNRPDSPVPYALTTAGFEAVEQGTITAAAWLARVDADVAATCAALRARGRHVEARKCLHAHLVATVDLRAAATLEQAAPTAVLRLVPDEPCGHVSGGRWVCINPDHPATPGGHYYVAVGRAS